MTDEELERFALVLKECERIRALIAREEAALSNGEHDHGIPSAAAPSPQAQEGRPQEGFRKVQEGSLVGLPGVGDQGGVYVGF
jgi:hypothetical protein